MTMTQTETLPQIPHDSTSTQTEQKVQTPMASITSPYTTKIIYYHPIHDPSTLKLDLIAQIIDITNGAFLSSNLHTDHFGFNDRFDNPKLYLAQLTNTGAWVVVAHDSTGRLVGSANFKLDCTGMDAQPVDKDGPTLDTTEVPGKDPYRHIYISALAVDHTLKRSGLGGLLMRRIEKYITEELEVERVEEDGKRIATCWAMDHTSRTNELFYLKNGYREAERKYITHRPWGSFKDFWWLKLEKELMVKSGTS